MGANRPERCRFEVMIWVTPRAIEGSGSAPPTKSGSAIGIGCMLPSVIVILGAARTRDHTPPAIAARDRPAAPAKRRRRESVSSSDRMFRFPIAPGFDETQYPIRQTTSAATEHLGIEIDRKYLPAVVFRWRKHRVGLALNDGAHRALDQGTRILVSGPHLHFRRCGKSPIRLQADGDRNRDLQAIGSSRGRSPAIPEMSPEGVKLAKRRLVRVGV